MLIEIRVARESDKQDKDGLPAITFNQRKFIEITSLPNLTLYEKNAHEGIYLHNINGNQQLIIIKDFSYSSFDGNEEEKNKMLVNKNFELESWVKLHVTDSKTPAKERVNMPWKGDDIWLSSNPGIKSTQNAWIICTSEDTLRS